MIIRPQDATIARHIDYYWIVENTEQFVENSTQLIAYPGITPDLLIVLDGHYEFNYLGRKLKQNKSMLFSFIHEEIQLNLSLLNSFILVKFKSRALASLIPFVNYTSKEIMKKSVCFSETVFDESISQLPKLVKNKTEIEVGVFLDHWFLSFYKKEREGFVVEMAEEICSDFSIQKIMAATNYSYSTIGRYFKRETGLTPKKFQTLRRFKSAATEICVSKNTDWMNYIAAYNYYDQAHFIHDIKRFTKLTPKQLLQIQSFVSFRPHV